jgi:hypothetical protein
MHIVLHKKYFQKITKFFEKYRLQIIVGISAVIVIPTVVAAAWFGKEYVLPSSTVYAQTKRDTTIQTQFIENSLPIELTVHKDGREGTTEPATLSIRIDGQEVHTQPLTITNEPQTVTFSQDTSNLSEDSHTVHAVLISPKGKTFWEDSWTIKRDVSVPVTAEATLSDTTSGAKIKTATDSGKVSITTSKAVAVNTKLQFSEPGVLTVTQPSGVTLDWDTTLTQTPEVRIPAGQPPFTASYTFADQAKHTVTGELSYFYDNQPPTFTVTSSLNMTNKWGDGYGLSFYPSEPVTELKVTYNGTALAPYTHTIYKNVAKATLSLGSNNVFVISGKDANGNIGTKTVTVTMTQDPNPVAFPSSRSSFRPCTPEIRQQCREKVGYTFGSDDECGKFKEYVYCLRPICDSTTGHNICGNSEDL